MNLLFVIPEYPPHGGGGIVTFYRNLLPELARCGHHVRVLVGSAFSSEFPAYEREGIAVESMDSKSFGRNLEKFTHYHSMPELQRHLAAAWTLWEQANGGAGYDLVETSDWGLLFIPWVAEDGPPVVVQMHGSVGQIDYREPRKGEEVKGRMIRMLEMLLLPLADELQTYGYGNADEWKSLLNNEVFHLYPAWSPQSSAQGEPSLSAAGLVVGRIQHWKGPQVLCEALRLIEAPIPLIQWIGRDTPAADGSSTSKMLAAVYPDVWGKKVIAVGPKTPEEAARLQAQAAFVIVPSLWDVFNFTAVEAMGYCRPVLCSSGAGASQLIDHKKNGLAFASGDPGSLADALKTLLDMPFDVREKLGELGKQTVTSSLNPSRVSQERIARYEEVLKEPRSCNNQNEWLLDAVKPSVNHDHSMTFLNQLPLKKILKYLPGRAWRTALKRLPPF